MEQNSMKWWVESSVTLIGKMHEMSDYMISSSILISHHERLRMNKLCSYYSMTVGLDKTSR
jgi:hypothetical protein